MVAKIKRQVSGRTDYLQKVLMVKGDVHPWARSTLRLHIGEIVVKIH